MPERLSVSVDDAADMIGVSVRRMWELIRADASKPQPDIPSFTDGRRRLIRVSDLRAWVEAQDAATEVTT